MKAIMKAKAIQCEFDTVSKRGGKRGHFDTVSKCVPTGRGQNAGAQIVGAHYVALQGKIGKPNRAKEKTYSGEKPIRAKKPNRAKDWIFGGAGAGPRRRRTRAGTAACYDAIQRNAEYDVLQRNSVNCNAMQITLHFNRRQRIAIALHCYCVALRIEKNRHKKSLAMHRVDAMRGIGN